MGVDIASGNIHLEYEDVSIPGKIELVWDRRYSGTLLARPITPLGLGWTCRYFATLTKHSDSFEFGAPNGSVETLPDPDGTVEHGGVVRNLGAFLEIFKHSGRYVVQRWDVESGEVRRYCFAIGPLGRPLPLGSIEDLSGLDLLLSRDSQGRLTSIHQRLEERTLHLEYNKGGLIQAVVFQAPNGERHMLVRYEYDDAGRMIAAFDALDNADRYDYDRDGRVAREIAKHGGITSYRYDNKGRCVWSTGLDRYDEKRLRFLEATRLTEVTDSYNNTYRYKYLPSGQIESEWDPLGAETGTTYDDHGRITARVSATGGITRYEYDERGNRSKIVDALGNMYSLAYNENHQVTILTDPNDNVWKHYYDRFNRLIRIDDPLGAQRALHYDDQGNVVALTNPKGDSCTFQYHNGVLTQTTDWLGNSTFVEFDGQGRLTARIDEMGNAFRYYYNLVGHLIRVLLPDGTQIHAAYDAGGNLVQFTDAARRVTTRRYGPCRRLLERIDPNGSKVSYVWGTEPGRLQCVINERGEVYRFFYNEAGHCTQEIAFDGRKLQFAYDLAGWCIRAINGAGEAIEIVRDPLGRIVGLSQPDGEVARFGYDNLGNLVEAVNTECAVRLERDPIGRIVREVQGDHWVKHSVDSLGEVTRVETDLGHSVDYDLGPNGVWSGLHTADGHAIQFRRDARGQEVERWLPGGLVLDQRHDSVGRLIEQRLSRRPRQSRGSAFVPGTATPDAATRVRRIYTREGSGLVTAIGDEHYGTTRYAYDPGERLLQVLRDRGSTERFEYDAAGNRTRILTESRDSVEDEVLAYGAGNRLLRMGSTQYEYDAQGRLVRRVEDADTARPRSWCYEWNALDQLRAITRPDGQVWHYGYDALGRRVRKSGPHHEVRFIWSGNVPIHEIAGRDRAWTSWIFAPRGFVPLAQVKDREMYPVITDHVGVPQEMVDRLGRVVWRLRSKAYGAKEFEAANGRDCPFRFQGQYHDIESGLDYNRFRYYDATIGRYISPDPMGLKGGQHLYAYAHNPLGWIDPFGLCPIVTGGFPPEEEAAINATLGHIDANTVPAGPTATRWGIPFQNREGNLPGQPGALPTPYTEYRVAPAPGTPGAGPRRVVVNNSNGATYYTWTHYGDAGPPAFVRIR